MNAIQLIHILENPTRNNVDSLQKIVRRNEGTNAIEIGRRMRSVGFDLVRAMVEFANRSGMPQQYWDKEKNMSAGLALSAFECEGLQFKGYTMHGPTAIAIYYKNGGSLTLNGNISVTGGLANVCTAIGFDCSEFLAREKVINDEYFELCQAYDRSLSND